MSIYDRDYMGGNARQRGGFGSGRPRISFEFEPVKFLIAANVLVFFIEAFAERIWGEGSFFSLFGLTLENLAAGKIWTIVTYSFLHADILHIFCNMLGLFFIGKYLERMLGARRFLALYFVGAVVGGLAWSLVAALEGSREVLVGASASVMAVFAGFCLMYPPIPITFLLFFVLPISLKPITMLKIAAAIESAGLLYTLAGGNAVVAYSAHLGGIISGLLFVKLLSKGKLSFIDKFKFGGFGRRKNADTPVKGGSAADYPFKVNISDDGEISAEVDRILDKINRSGFASLTEDERETLRRAHDNLK